MKSCVPIVALRINPLPLAALGLLCACALPAGHSPPSPLDASGVVCSGDLSEAQPELVREYPQFKRRIEAGPFFRALVQRLGAPSSCVRSVQAGGLQLAYVFPRDSTLLARIDPRIELSEQRIDSRALAGKDAFALLQATETAAFGKQGCGIAWQGPAVEEPGVAESRDLVYRGDTCNCQARVAYRGATAVALLFRSTC